MYTYQYPMPSVTVDCIVRKWDCINEKFTYLMIKRGGEPDKGKWAFPGGFIDMNETMLESAYRELYEETGIASCDITLNFHFIADHPKRDSRGRTLAGVFYGDFYLSPVIKAGDDAVDYRWMDKQEIFSSYNIAFDHREIFISHIGGLPESEYVILTNAKYEEA